MALIALLTAFAFTYSPTDSNPTPPQEPLASPREPTQTSSGELKEDHKDTADFHFKGRVIAGHRTRVRTPHGDQLEAGTATTTHKLQLRQARVGFYASYLKALDLKISADFADFMGNTGPGEVLRDAWVNVRIHKLFQVKVGEFKRPYSTLELTASAKLPMLGRGMFNSEVVENLGWGDRASGVMLWGQTKPKRAGLHRVRWELSATNSAVAGAPPGLDTHARLTYAPVKGLSLGLSGAFKRIEAPLEEKRDVVGGDVDLTVRARGLRLTLEADLAQSWNEYDAQLNEFSPWMLAGIAWVSYDFKLKDDWVLQPAASFEYFDSDMDFSETESIRVVGNFNIHWTRHLMVRPQVEYVRPLNPVSAQNLFTETQTYGLWLQVQI